MAQINLTKGKYAIVDDKDFEYLSQWKWHYSAFRYAARRLGKDGPVIYMHRLITDCPPSLQVDHINHNGLDNRKSNLRVATKSQNSWNRGSQTNNKLKIKGVIRVRDRYRARIKVAGSQIHLGYFNSAEEAHQAYVQASRKYFGEFSYV